MNYAAYLRVYEPVSAFHEPDRSRWSAYALSASRPRRRDALAAEHAEALCRIVTSPPASVPEEESEHAYVRSADGVAYVCPWQTRLRSLLACGDGENKGGRGGDGSRGGPRRAYIKTSRWTVPLAWFVPFAGNERWIAFGPLVSRSQRGDSYGTADDPPSAAYDPRLAAYDPRITARVGRTLVYVTPMTRARRRVSRGLAALRDQAEVEAELPAIARWLEGFHPGSLVELDYGGLVYLLSDNALWRDESAAEMAAAIDAMSRGHCELAAAMYGRTQMRWRTFGEFEQAN